MAIYDSVRTRARAGGFRQPTAVVAAGAGSIGLLTLSCDIETRAGFSIALMILPSDSVMLNFYGH